MNRIVFNYHLLPGDRIKEPKSAFGIVQHHSIYLGQDIYGVDWMAENKVGHGVRIITADQYFATVTKITEIVRLNGSWHDREIAVKRALSQAGKPYSLINFNCEHYANYVQHGYVSSAQVAKGALGLAGLFFLGLILAGGE